jgi:hypothetical protein
MPATITLYLIGVWICVGFFTGFGWSVGSWLAARLLSHA